MKYYVATNTGKGFITHEDNALAHISAWPGNIWVTENTAWAARVGAVEKTKEEAQAIVDLAVSESVANKQEDPRTERLKRQLEQQNQPQNQPIILP